MYIVTTSIYDSYAPYLVVFCLDKSEARHEADLLAAQYPDNDCGIWTDSLDITDCLRTIGYGAHFVDCKRHIPDHDLVPYLQFMLPYCAPRLQDYLQGALTRMCAYRLSGNSLSCLE